MPLTEDEWDQIGNEYLPRASDRQLTNLILMIKEQQTENENKLIEAGTVH